MAGDLIGCDVLVLGGGIGGCYAAIKAGEAGADVILVDKAHVGRSGFSPMMSGVFSYFDPQKDDYDAFCREAVELGEWMNDQDRLAHIVLETGTRVREMDAWGVKFQKERGQFIRRPGAGALTRMNVLMTNSGLQMMAILRGEVFRRKARVIERVMITDLLTSDGETPTSGRVTGAAGFSIRTGRFYAIAAKAVIIATGSTNSLLGYAMQRNLSGDGKAMAYWAGAQMRNLELAWWEPTSVGQATSAGFGILAGEGAVLLTARGERFMEKYDPVRMEKTSRVRVGQAIALEEAAGRGPCYWDATQLDDAAFGRIEKCIPILIRNFEARGIDFRKDMLQYGVVMGDEIAGGGIRVNVENASSLPGLFAVGDAADGSNSGVCNTVGGGQVAAIDGCHAGVAAAGYAAEAPGPVTRSDQISRIKEKILAPLKRQSGLRHTQARRHCLDIIESGWVGPVKVASKLKTAAQAARDILENEMPELAARDYHELSRCIGVRNELLFLELFAHCSLLRTESRGAHYREDYPENNNSEWLKWIILKNTGRGPETWNEPIPFERYPLKPEGLKGASSW